MKKLAVIILLSLSSQVLFAWGQNGHRIVAQICFDNLAEKTRKEIAAFIGDNYLAQLSTWPDYIKSEKNWDFIKNWHFTTINPDQTVEQAVAASKSGNDVKNVVDAIELMKAILKGDAVATKKFEDLMNKNGAKPLAGSVKATALALMLHFIGDIHQPMHVGKNNDLGGNKITVLFFSEKTNLHAVWDEAIIEQEQLSYTEFAAFAQKHTAPQKTAWQNAGIDVWIKESIETREKIYNTLYDNTDRDTGLPSFGYSYQHDFLPIVENRLSAAGYRTAAILNAIFNP